MNEGNNIRNELLATVKLATQYCALVEQVADMERDEFVKELIKLLPQIYLKFCNITPEDVIVSDYGYYTEYVDEQLYETVRRRMEIMFGPDDMFLETFEEDMKYSDTPIAVSIAECLADIFQPLYNFIYTVKESEGGELEGAYLECRDNFTGYWSRTLCNVMRPLNSLCWGI